jgi:hypothetical protein
MASPIGFPSSPKGFKSFNQKTPEPPKSSIPPHLADRICFIDPSAVAAAPALMTSSRPSTPSTPTDGMPSSGEQEPTFQHSVYYTTSSSHHRPSSRASGGGGSSTPTAMSTDPTPKTSPSKSPASATAFGGAGSPAPMQGIGSLAKRNLFGTNSSPTSRAGSAAAAAPPPPNGLNRSESPTMEFVSSLVGSGQRIVQAVRAASPIQILKGAKDKHHPPGW